ncbi:class I SAM-dependent methyltransferase, partial [Candidatus Omnitrophota bacterium]
MAEKRLARLFDFIGSEFESELDRFSSLSAQTESLCAAIFKQDKLAGTRVLDAGCGSGRACIYFSKKQATEVFGLDLSPQSLEVGRSWSKKLNLAGIDLQVGDISKLPFTDQTFDIVFSLGATPYVKDNDATIDELARVLSKNGTMAIFFLRKGRLDLIYELPRILLSKFAPGPAYTLARVLAIMLKPFSKLLVGRLPDQRKGKPLEQIILETIFSPVRLNKQDPKRISTYIRDLLNRKTFVSDVG